MTEVAKGDQGGTPKAKLSREIMTPLEQYNQLHASGQFNWTDVELDDLPLNTRDFVARWLSHVEYKVHTPAIGEQYFFKIEGCDPVAYLLHDPQAAAHIWADEDFENIEDNTALAIIATKKASEITGQSPEELAKLGTTEMLRKAFDEVDKRIIEVLGTKEGEYEGRKAIYGLTTHETFEFVTATATGIVRGSPGMFVMAKYPMTQWLFQEFKVPDHIKWLVLIDNNGPAREEYDNR
jgi:hypothetical protein